MGSKKKNILITGGAGRPLRGRASPHSKILVTGGAGYIGLYLADLFRKAGFSVMIFDIIARPDTLAREIEYFKGDVTDKKSWQKALRGITHVVHLAAYGDNYPDFHRCFTVNAAGTALLYEAIRDGHFPIKQVVVTSSQSVYGEGKYLCKKHGVFYPISRPLKDLEVGRWDIRCSENKVCAEVIPSEEDDKLTPSSPYGISKMAQDHIALNMGKEFGIPSVAFRYAMVSGAYPSMRAIYPNAIKFFSEQALKKELIFMHEDGGQSRDFVDIKDLGKAHLAVLDNSASYFQAFNIGSGSSVKIRDLAEMICRIARVKFQPVFKNEFRPFTPRHMAMSINKAKRLLSWKPECSLEQSVQGYIAAIRKTKKFDKL